MLKGIAAISMYAWYKDGMSRSNKQEWVAVVIQINIGTMWLGKKKEKENVVNGPSEEQYQ